MNVSGLLGSKRRSFRHKKKKCKNLPSIVVIIPSFNNSQWVEKNLGSLFEQDYPLWRALYIDDCSTDDTFDRAQRYTQKSCFLSSVTFIRNTRRCLAMENLYHAYHSCADDEVVVVLDGDDWLCRSDALSIIGRSYLHKRVWLTYGNYQHVISRDGKQVLIQRKVCHAIHREIIERNRFRFYGHLFSPGHPFSCYAWLFKQIKLKDILYCGSYAPMGYDAACRFPLLEMAYDRFQFINTTLYHLNRISALNDSKVDSSLQRRCLMNFVIKDCYQSLEERPLPASKTVSSQIGMLIFAQSYVQAQDFFKNLDHAWRTNYQACFCITESESFFDDFMTFIKKDTMRYVMVMRADRPLPTVYHDLEVMAGLLERTYARAFYGALTQESFTQEVGAPLNYVQDGVYAWQFSHDKRNAHTFIERLIDEHNLPIPYEVVHESEHNKGLPLYCGSRQVLYKRRCVEEYMGNLPRMSFDDLVDNFMDSSLFADDIGLVCL